MVCSAATSLPEVAGGAAALADPERVGDIERALAEVLGSGPRRAQLRRLGLQRAGQFSWRRCAQLTADAYRRAAGWRG